MPRDRLIFRIKQNLHLKITILVTFLTAVLTISFTTYFIVHERHSYTEQLRKEGELLASIAASKLLIPLYAGNNEEVARQVTEIFRQTSVCNVTVLNSAGEEIINVSRNAAKSPGKALTVKKAIQSDAAAQTPESLLIGDTGVPELVGTVELSMDTAKIGIMTKKLILVSSLLSLTFWLLANAISLVLVKRITYTFKTLMAGVKRIEQGDLSVSLPANDGDEAGRALAAINSLAESLQRKNEENERLQAEVVKGLRLQIDEEKSAYMAKLIQTNRMTSLGLLVSSMAHEINNPNGAIRLAAEILERGWRDIQPVLDEVATVEGEFKLCGMPYRDALEDIENAVDAIKRSSIRIEWVVQNLRSYSLGDREKQLLSFDLSRVAENSVAIIRAHGKMENIAINTEFSPDLPQAYGNPFQLEQVVTNLLLNAIQAMSTNNGKIITITTGTDPASGELLLVIDDSGPGISAENLPYIFEPFFSTRIENGGSGLGLYIADFIVKEQNGSLEISNNENGGCRGVIRLPAAKSNKLQNSETTQASCSG